jgi:hypothetical protein
VFNYRIKEKLSVSLLRFRAPLHNEALNLKYNSRLEQNPSKMAQYTSPMLFFV